MPVSPGVDSVGRPLPTRSTILLALDPGRRGIAGFFRPGAALAAARALAGARRVLITTGFTVPTGAPETDGPPGAAVLGRALRRLGARVRYVTDAVTVPLLEAALAALGEPTDVFDYPEAAGAARPRAGARATDAPGGHRAARARLARATT